MSDSKLTPFLTELRKFVDATNYTSQDTDHNHAEDSDEDAENKESKTIQKSFEFFWNGAKLNNFIIKDLPMFSVKKLNDNYHLVEEENDGVYRSYYWCFVLDMTDEELIVEVENDYGCQTVYVRVYYDNELEEIDKELIGIDPYNASFSGCSNRNPDGSVNTEELSIEYRDLINYNYTNNFNKKYARSSAGLHRYVYNYINDKMSDLSIANGSNN